MPTAARKPKKKTKPTGFRDPKLIKGAPDKVYRDLVEKARMEQDLSVQALADGCKMGRPTISRWLNGSRRLYAEDLARIFEFLGIKVK